MSARVKLAPFPRSVRTYVGRTDELGRALEWLERETLFLIYGVGGIGKSEFVYRVIEEAAQTPRWRDATTVLLQVRPGMTAEHVVARLRVGLGVKRALVDIRSHSTASSRLDEELAETARMLDDQPSLVFIDDVHHLDTGASHMLGYLSRHVRASRLLVASRMEVPLPPGTPMPVVIRLSPLDADSTGRMATQLADRLGISRPDTADVYARSGGSPFFVQQIIAGHAGHAPIDDAADDSALGLTLRELAPEPRRILLVFAVTRGRFATAEVAADDAELAGADDVIRELSRRFLVDVSRDVVMVHDLVRDSLIRQATDAELAAANRRAAGLHQRRYERDPRRGGLDAVETVYHLIDAGDDDAAWEFAGASYASIAAAGLDHLLVDALAALQRALPDQATAIDLMSARILIRRSLIAEAGAILERVEARGDDPSLRYLTLAGEVAQRLGRLRRAETLYVRARDLATHGAERFQTALQLSEVRSLRGLNDQARAVLDAALTQFEPASARERGRWGWAVALSHVLGERFDLAAACAREAADELAGAGADDLELLLAMIEVLCRAECNEIGAARQVLDRIESEARAASSLREHVLSLYSGVVLYARGTLRRARVALESSLAYLEQHGDHLMSQIAGYYLCRTMLAQGDIARAVALSERLARVVIDSELATFVPTGMASYADALLAAGRIDEAAEWAGKVLDSPLERANARWVAYTVIMRCRALAGDIDAARRYHDEALEYIQATGVDHYRLPARLERASIELMVGDLDRAVDAAAAAWRGYAECGRQWLEARSAVALAAALVARGHATDVLAAEEPLARAETLAHDEGYPRVVARCALVRGALLARDGHAARSRQHLMASVRALDAHVDRPEIAALRAALQRAGDDTVLPGERAVVARLGFARGVRYRIVDRATDRTGAESDVIAERQRRDLVVEPTRATITAGHGDRSDQGRPMACELLARLIEGQGAVVTAEELFRDVWGGREYHPLRNRNTVYVAVKRLRQTLRKLLGDGEIIETASGGWRIAEGIDAVSIRPIE